MLESQSDGIEDILADDDDLAFNASDFDRLRMLDKFRERLKEESEHLPVGGDMGGTSENGDSGANGDNPKASPTHDDIRV